MLSNKDRQEGPLKRIKKGFNNPFICLGSFSLVLGLLLSSSIKNCPTTFAQGKTEEVQNLFLTSAKISWVDSPDFLLIEENSIAPFSPPVVFTPQVLGTLVGNPETYQSQIKKDVFEYVVEEGETLSAVAEKFNIDVNTIVWANNLSSNSTLTKGKKLVILPVKGVLHLVEKGDTLSGIATLYKIDTNKIIEQNGIDENSIFYGDLLIIPGGKQISSPAVKYVSLPSSFFISPTKGVISQGLHFYNAVDIANKCGTPIYAVAAGKIYEVKRNTWPGGNVIKIEHINGVITYYGHLSSIIVSAGQEVSKGQRIGYMGNTGLTIGSTGCHLHFDVLDKSVRNPFAGYSLGTSVSW